MEKEKKEKQISVKLDKETENKLNELVAKRGPDKSSVIRMLINGAQIINLGDPKGLATDFYKIRTALECGDKEIVKEVNGLCRSLSALMAKIENYSLLDE